MVMMSMVRHGLITFVNVLVLGVAISVTILTDNVTSLKFPSVLEIASTQMTIFVKPRPYRRLTRSWCRWCCKRAAMQDLFKLRDGPLDWYFCDSEHALDWLEHRHSSVEANRLLRMLPDERARALNGRTIEEVILKNPHA
jgi:hypothetical protein